MQAMIKTSRLEAGVISLEKKEQPIYDTLAAALGGILLGAEKKQIDVQVDCPEHLEACHDRKWTGEALFNILDNAVKYTPAGGQIHVFQSSTREQSSNDFTGRTPYMMWRGLGSGCIWPVKLSPCRAAISG